MNNNQQQTSTIKDTFDAVSGGYDSHVLRFFIDSARHLAAILKLQGNEHVLDVATGTGNAALCIAGCIPDGRVTGIDFSTGMLERAKLKAKLQRISNVTFVEQDMHSMMLTDTSFDTAICCFGIFFAADMHLQLTRIADMVKPGGMIAITGFQENYFQPLSGMMFDRLANYGISIPPQPWKTIATEDGCRAFFERAGLRNIRVEAKNMGYHLHDENEWWEIIWNAGFRRYVSLLPEDDHEQFKIDHLQEVAKLKTDKGIWLDIGVLFTIGSKPL